MQFQTDFRFDMDDSFSLQSRPMSLPSSRMTSPDTAWLVDLTTIAEALLRYPEDYFSSVGLATELKRKHSSSNIRENTCPSEQSTPSKTRIHYTISQDCTAGFEAREMQLLADFGKKCQGQKNYFGHFENMLLGSDVSHRHTDSTEKIVSQVANPGVARSHSPSPVVHRKTIQAQQPSQKIVDYPRSLNDDIYMPNRMGKAESSSSKEGRDIGKPCRICAYVPQSGTLHFEVYMAEHMMLLHPGNFLRCPYPGCRSQFRIRDNMQSHQRRMGHFVEDEDLGMQMRQRSGSS